jgi:ion channel POLLUX/CASTOR
MKVSIKEKLKYRFEKYLNKGGSSIFISLFVIFIVLFVFIIIVRWAILWIWPDLAYTDNFLDDIWYTWLQLTDPGNMNQDNLAPTWLKITTIMSGVVGVIILSMLIAFITTTLEKVFYNFRKGRGKVLEEDFTLILGWNERVVDIIRELMLANESEKDAAVVILSNEDKEEMEDLITKRIPNSLTTRIITTTGDFANINELKRINIEGAKSIILLANCSESASEDDKMFSDVQSIKAIMAIIACQGGKNELPIIAEIFNENKRNLIGYFEDEKIIALDSWEIMGKLLVQTSLTSGLEMVYNEILSFDGCEIYFYEADWNKIAFGDLPMRFKDGIPLGIYNENDGMTLRPGKEYILKQEDQILILAEDDSTIKFQPSSIHKITEIKLVNSKLEQKQKNILILGWHNLAEIFINESEDYLLEGSTFDIHIKEPSDEIKSRINELKELYKGFVITLTDSDSLNLESLKAATPFNYDNVVILSQDSSEQRADKIDSDTLIILLLLRKIKSELPLADTKIITQVLNSENQEIITQTDVDDFIISNKLITMILAQLSEQPLIMKFYEDIFSEDGSEIYVKSIALYSDTFPIKTTFGDLIGLADQRNEICLGIRKGRESKNAKANFGVTLNLDKNEALILNKDDFLVVLSEDEL